MPAQKVTLITAASRGMGAAIARRLAADGYRLALMRGGTMPNLWPFEILVVSWAGLVLLAILYGARGWTRDERAGGSI